MSALGLLTQFGSPPPGGGPPGDFSWAILSMPSRSNIGFNWQHGWRFTVGGAAISAVSLRAWIADAESWTLRLWRYSDSSLIGSVVVNGDGVAKWQENDLSSPVVLAAGQDYAVTRRRTGGSSGAYEFANIAGWTIAPEVAFVRGVEVNGDGFPDNSGVTNMLGPVDVGFLA